MRARKLCLEGSSSERLRLWGHICSAPDLGPAPPASSTLLVSLRDLRAPERGAGAPSALPTVRGAFQA